MPTVQDSTYLIEVMSANAKTQDFLSHDVDLLVSQIKENLRLNGLKAKTSVVQGNRSTPYRVPSRSWTDSANCAICSAKNQAEKWNELCLRPEHDQQCHPQLSQLRQHRQFQSYQRPYQRNDYHRHSHHHHHHHYHHRHHHHRYLHRRRCSKADREEDDPYELLQELLREGGLIKEAVKRLRANLEELESSEDEAEEEEEEDEEDEGDDLENGMILNRDGPKERSRIYRRKPYLYDSEEESLTSVYEPLEL